MNARDWRLAAGMAAGFILASGWLVAAGTGWPARLFAIWLFLIVTAMIGVRRYRRG